MLVANRFVGKRFTLGADGEIAKTAAGNISEWGAVRQLVSTASELAIIIGMLGPEMALVLGKARDEPETFVLSPNGTRRTRDVFSLSNGPGWLLLDYDSDAMPETVRRRIAELGGPLAAMEYVWPELKDACRVWKPSSSGGVHKTREAPPTDIMGFHLYVLVADQSKSKETLETLQARAWAEGLGWIKVSASGALLTRSIFDTSVWAPERLVFAGPPDLGEGVSRTAPQIVAQEGKALQPPQRPPGTAWVDALAAAKAAIKPSAVKTERTWRKAQVRRVMAEKKVSARAAFKAVKSLASVQVLEDDVTLEMNDGSIVRVGDLLDRGIPGDKLSLPSPLDGLTYGPGKATLLWSKGRPPVIVDHAHGLKRLFRFARFGEVHPVVQGGYALPPAAVLVDGSMPVMTALLRQSDQDSAGPNVMAVANRLFFRIPAQWSLPELISWIRDELPPDVLPTEFFDALSSRLAFRLEQRKLRTLAPYTLPPEMLGAHKVERVDTLSGSVSGLPTGVVVVQAPMGVGKTQHVGAPLIQAAKEQGLTVMAMCHRTSLTAELAKRLDLATYTRVSSADIEARGGLAVCLPSTARADIVAMMPKPDVVFIDEVRQVLAFLAHPEQCRTSDATAVEVYDRLRQIIKNARTVIVADAHIDGRTLRFLEECRPGERFQIMIAEPQRASRTAEFRFGSVRQVRESVISEVLVELAGGGKVWLACESSEFAQAMESLFIERGYRAIAITAGTKANEAQAAFLEDAELASQSYDIVIASPVISSGLSIEHRGAPHFTLVAFLGSGNAITPGDAAQQIARVRYVDRCLVGVMRNNLPHNLLEEQLLGGRAAALALQNDQVMPGSYDQLVVGLKVDEENGRADFASGLFWLLEREDWLVCRGSLGSREKETQTVLDAHRQVRSEKLMAAPEVSVEVTVEQLRMLRELPAAERSEYQSQIEALETQLEAARIREALGVWRLLEEDIDLWDEGRLLSRLERFVDLGRIGSLPTSSTDVAFSLRSLRAARRQLYADLFEGYDIAQPDWLTPEVAEEVLDRVMRKPELFAACGLVGPKYASGYIDKVNQIVPLKRPADPVREVTDILRRAGLTAVGKQVRVSQREPNSS